MGRAVLVIAVLLVASTGLARAGEVHVKAEAETIYDNNVFGTAQNTVGDESLRITPSLEVIQAFPRFGFHLRYQPAFEQFVHENAISGFDQAASGTFHWRVGQLTDMYLSDDFRHYHSYSQFNQQIITGTVPSLETVDQRHPFNNNVASLRLQHFLSPRQALELDGSYSLWNYSQQSRRDFQVISSGLNYNNAISESLAAGARLSWSRQIYDSIGTVPQTHTDYYNLSPHLNIQFDPTLEFSISAGPTLVVSQKPPSPPQTQLAYLYPTRNTAGGPRLLDTTTCATLPNGTPYNPGSCDSINTDLSLYNSVLQAYGLRPIQDALVIVPLTGSVPSTGGSSVTVFGNVALSKRWDRWTVTLAYQRQQDESSGLGVSSIASIARTRVVWTPTPRWTAIFSGGWVHRVQSQKLSQPVVGLSAVDPCAFYYFGYGVPPPSGGFCGAIANAAQSTSLQVPEFNNDISVTNYYASLRADYMLSKHIDVFGRILWSRQVNTGSFRVSQTVNRFVARIGVGYQFAPFRF